MAASGENHREEETREPVLSPVDRVSEVLFGLFMALTFVGAVSVEDTARQRSELGATQQVVPSFFMQKPIACRHS